jgi:methylglutaconyl-CoA hydratase
MSSTPLRVERRDRVAVLTLNRPDQRNALSRELVLALGRAGRELLAGEPPRLIVITGAGERAFCSGADLKERAAMDEDTVRAQLRLYRSELGWIDPSPVPVVAAINGAAFGGGLELALMCDLRVATAHAEFGCPETSLGIIPGAGGTQRLPRLIGEARAKELILLGRRIGATEAHGMGLVNHVVPTGAPLVERTLEYTRPIVEGAPLAQTAALRSIEEGRCVPLERGLDLELAHYEPCLTSADRREALQARVERRPPRFRGA